MSMKTLAVLCLPLLLAVPARAQMSAGISINNDGVNSFYLAIGQTYNVPQRQVVVFHERQIPDEELPVIYFIARRARVTPDAVVNLRLSGMSWMDITLHYRLSPSIYYIALNGDPGPEYGRAYGQWKQPRRQWSQIRLDDEDIVKMVNLQFVSSHYGIRPDEVVRLRGQHPNFINVTQEVSSPDYQSHRATARRQQSPQVKKRQNVRGQDNGRGNGNGNGRGQNDNNH